MLFHQGTSSKLPLSFLGMRRGYLSTDIISLFVIYVYYLSY